jgi:CRP/FNR family transcriptional regulator, cyclic AMP receptor protein
MLDTYCRYLTVREALVVADQRIHDLRSVPLFADCSDRQLAEIARLTDELWFEPGEVLVREGRIGHECFVLAEGEAVVSISGEPIAWVGPGDIVGEMAIVSLEPRVATVTCASRVRVYVMTSQAFTAVFDHCPSVMRKVLATVAHRLREIEAA